MQSPDPHVNLPHVAFKLVPVPAAVVVVVVAPPPAAVVVAPDVAHAV